MNFSEIKYKITNFFITQFGSLPSMPLFIFVLVTLCILLYMIRKVVVQKGLDMDRDMVMLVVGFIAFFVIFYKFS